MRELYHYTQQKEDGLWDCVSESIPSGVKLKELEIVHKFDWCVKQSFEEGEPFLGAIQKERIYGFYMPRWGRTYDRYFSAEMKLEDVLSDGIKARFIPEQSGKNTSGNEFSSGKFYSVASSSRFAVASFTEKGKDGKLDYIETIKINGKEESITAPEFEHDTPVEGIGKNSRSPQLDFFFKTAHGTYFIEAKNHEILDDHKSIELRFSYRDTDAFKRLGLIGDPCKREYVDSKGKVQQYISLIKDDNGKKHFLQAKDFGCELDTFHFDFKQFLCHLMGIWSYAQKHPKEDIYFYYLIYRNKLYEENYDKILYKELEAEVKTVFEVFGKRFPRIHFGLCYHDNYNTLTELNESSAIKDEAKDKQEKWEAGFLFDHLGVIANHKCESPDFTFVYEGRQIGLEHTRCYPSQKTIDINSWRKIERKIEKELNKSELPPRYFCYCAQTHNEGRKNFKYIAEEILKAYKYMLENEIYYIGALGHKGYHLNRLTDLSYFPGYAPDHFIVHETTGGFESKADIKLVLESVEKKENKLIEYKQLSKNNTIQEYWLTIFIPPEEACIVESNTTLFQNSLYDRIYLINGRYIGALMQGDTSSIMRLK